MKYTIIVQTQQGEKVDLLDNEPVEMRQITQDVIGDAIPNDEQKAEAVKQLRVRFPNYRFTIG